MTNSANSTFNEELMLEQLKEILLKEDRAELHRLHAILDDRQLLAQKVDPIVEEHITYLKENYPIQFREVVDDLIDQKIKDSTDEILNVIYPVLGKMIKKYIAHQFQLLKENIDSQVKNTFSSQGIWGRVKASLFGIKDSEIILSDHDKPRITEIFVIQRDSGLLIGSASVEQSFDQDVVAGMLTAIKAFVEDAFRGGEQNLGMIEYDTHRIFIQNFPAFYIAVALTGSISSAEKDQLANQLFDFAEEELDNKSILMASEESFGYISEKLKSNFFNTPAPTI